jgi:hypothetical protein
MQIRGDAVQRPTRHGRTRAQQAEQRNQWREQQPRGRASSPRRRPSSAPRKADRRRPRPWQARDRATARRAPGRSAQRPEAQPSAAPGPTARRVEQRTWQDARRAQCQLYQSDRNRSYTTHAPSSAAAQTGRTPARQRPHQQLPGRSSQQATAPRTTDPLEQQLAGIAQRQLARDATTPNDSPLGPRLAPRQPLQLAALPRLQPHTCTTSTPTTRRTATYTYRRYGIGGYLGSLFYGSSYWITNPWQYRLPDVWGPYRWVRYYDDVLLVDIYTGEVVDVIYDFFW